MSRNVVAILTFTLLTLTAMAVTFTRVHGRPAGAVTRSAAGPAVQVEAPASISRPAPRPSPPAPTDLYGNEVSPAIANYTYDPAGAVYEEHSPQTEVPRLKPPTS